MNHEDKRPIIACDFDGTIVSNEFPNIGDINNNVMDWIRDQKENGATIILFTSRRSNYLKQACDFCEQNNIPIDYVNENPEWLDFETSRKIFADIYVDDRSVNPIGDPTKDLVEFASDKELSDG